MDLPLTLVDLAGSVALLLWGVHMVQTGVQRAFGAKLRGFLGGALRNRFTAFLAGLGVTALLQSSTATGLMTAGFAANGVIDLAPALAVMLGANVGTTLIVQLLSFDVAEVAPALVLVGVLMFRRASAGPRDFGRVLIGLGLLLMALHQFVALLTPYEDEPSLRLFLGAVSTQPLLDVLLAAGLTWAAHSSVAVVLVAMSFAAQGTVPPHAAFAMVMGANLGTAINPSSKERPERSRGQASAARESRSTALVGVTLGLALLPYIGPWLVAIDPNNARAVADFHTGFNLVLAVIFFPLLTPFAALLRRLIPARVDPADPSRPLYLDPSARETPVIALGGAAREALRMADVLESMLIGLRDMFEKADRRQIAQTKRLDDILDKLNAAIKTYLITLDPEALGETDHRRLREILTFATEMEHSGDIVDRNLLRHRQQDGEARRHLLQVRSGRAAGDDRPAHRQCPHRGLALHDGRRTRGAAAGERKGGVPRHGDRRDQCAFRAAAGGTNGYRRDKHDASRRSPRPQERQFASRRRRRLSGSRRQGRFVANPPSSGDLTAADGAEPRSSGVRKAWRRWLP